MKLCNARLNSIEPGIILSIAALIWIAGPQQPISARLSYVVLGLGAGLLLQSLLRDLWILWRRRVVARASTGAAVAAAKSGQYFCVESAVGLLGVVCGGLLLGSRFDAAITLERNILCAMTLCVLGTGFLIRDWVIQANPWRIDREPDHLNVIVRWRR